MILGRRNCVLLRWSERLLPLRHVMTANLLEFDLEGLAAFCERLGEKRFRATQLFRWIHQRGAASFDDMSDLAKSLREKLKSCAEMKPLAVITQHISGDGTIKWLFDVGGGDAVEAVFIPEDGLELPQDDCRGTDDLPGIEQVLDRAHFCPHQARSEDDAKVVLTHLALLRKRQYFLT